MSDAPPTFRLSGVIPYRRRKGRLEVLLVTSRRRGRWVIPKGRIEAHLSSRRSARREAFEEAGVKGKMSEDPLGWYKHRQNGTREPTEVYALHVKVQFDEWPEAGVRRRRWMPLREARRRLAEPGLRRLLDRLEAHLT